VRQGELFFKTVLNKKYNSSIGSGLLMVVYTIIASSTAQRLSNQKKKDIELL
jgi:hypothetical protein